MKNKLSANDEKFPFPLVQRIKHLEGRIIFTIMKSGKHYFLEDMSIYEDGVVDCGGYADLTLLKEKIIKGRWTPQIPKGSNLNVFHLGSWTLIEVNWIYSKDTYFDFILSIVQEMNPNLDNLFDSKGIESRIIGNSNRSPFGYKRSQIIRKDAAVPSFKNFSGERVYFFKKESEKIYELVSVNVYSDSLLLIEGIEFSQSIDLESFQKLVQQGIITVSLKENTRLKIKNLGTCKVGKCKFQYGIKDKITEIKDIIARLNGQPTTSEICSEMYFEYIENPTVEGKNRLKEIYEKVPSFFQSTILSREEGKDYPIRKIIYDKLT